MRYMYKTNITNGRSIIIQLYYMWVTADMPKNITKNQLHFTVTLNNLAVLVKCIKIAFKAIPISCWFLV